MPTVLRIGSYRFFFYSNEGNEPPHIHVERAEAAAKFWLTPDVRLAWSSRFRQRERTQLLERVQEHQELFLEKWNEYFES